MKSALVGFFVSIAGLFPQLAAAQPANDNCAAASVVAGLPFVDGPDATLATVEAADPVHSCTAAVDGNTVWYSYTAATNITLDIDTAGSSYGAVIAVYDGGCGALVERGCYVDPSAADSRLPINVTAGTTVLIQLSDPGLVGGPLAVEIREAPYAVGQPVSVVEAVNSASTSVFLGAGVGLIDGVTALSRRRFGFAATQQAVFREVGGIITKIAAVGDLTPAGGTYASFAGLTMMDTTIGAFRAQIDGAPGVTGGIFAFNNAAITAVAAAGDPAPNGGVFASFGEPSMNANGDLVFPARTDLGQAIYELPSGGVLAAIVTSGTASPCGGNFLAFDGIDVNLSGDLVFTGIPHGVYTRVGGVVSAVACEGDSEPGGGGVYDRFGDPVAINDVPEVVFHAEIDPGGPNVDAVYAGPLATVTQVIKSGGVTVTGETVDKIDGRGNLAINNNSELAFAVELSGTDKRGIAFATVGGAPSIIAKRLSFCAGSAIRELGKRVAMDDTGTVIVDAGCGVGSGTIRIVPIVGISSVAFHTDTTSLGTGFDLEPGQIDAAGNTLLLGRRTAVHQVQCSNAGVCSGPRLMVVAGDPWPTGGNTVRSILTDTIGGVRRPVFDVLTSGANPTEAIAMARNGARKIVETGDPTPDGAGTFLAIIYPDPFQPSGGSRRPAGHGGRVAFTAELQHPNFTHGVFLFRNNTIAAIAGDGQPSPDGGTFVDFSSPAIFGSKVAFSASTTVGACVMYARRPTMLAGVVCSGDPGPLPGTTIGAILSPPTFVRRNVVFSAEIMGGANSKCLFAANGTALIALACDGDPQPNGGTFAAFESPYDGGVTLRGSRADLAFATTDLNNGLGLHSWRGDTVSEIALDGAPAPAGGTFDLNFFFAGAAKGRVVFSSRVVGGTGSSAVFVAYVP